MANETNKEIRIGGKEILPGTESEERILIARLPTHTSLYMHLHVFRAKEPGPVLLLTAGIHGDEINGIETLRRMIRYGSLLPETGTVIAIPLVNVYGFIHGRRELPDGKDLNRSFPGSKKGSLARRLAGILMEQVLPLVDVGVDLHTGGDRRTNYPQIRCDFGNSAALDLAEGFAPPFILHSKPIGSSFRREAGRRGKPIIVYEGGESMRLDERAITEASDGIKRVMQHLGMKKEETPTRNPVMLAKSSWMRARTAGIFTPLVSYGQKVEKGQVTALLSDPNGKKETAVKAPSPCYVIGLNHLPVVHAGDALIHLGKD